MLHADFARRPNARFWSAVGLILIGSVSACGDSDDRHGKFDAIQKTPAITAFVKHQEGDNGKQRIGGLTKDELLAHIGIIHVGLALDTKCPTLSAETRASALQRAKHAEDLIQSDDDSRTLIESMRGSSRIFAASSDCDDSTKAIIGQVAPAAERMCAAFAQGNCSSTVRGTGQ